MGRGIIARDGHGVSSATYWFTGSRPGATTGGRPITEGSTGNHGARPESGEAIVVGAIGSAAPWFLTGWAHEVEIEFMIDTGCQVTILSTTVFELMCTLNPTVRSELQPCRRRLVSADSSPLIVQGQLELAIVFPGLCCDMLFVVANIGSDGLLGTEALQSYLPHQLDLRTCQLWADRWSTLQLHQQRLTPELDGFSTTPPNSEIVVNFSVSGIRPHGCTLVEPARCLTEEYGVVVGHTLVDASSGSGSVLIVNPNAEVVVLASCTRIGKIVPVVAISVAMEDLGLPTDGPAALPEYLEEIVRGSHPSLGDAGRQLLRDLLFRNSHVFPAPGKPVTGRTTAVQHDIIMMDAWPVCCGPRRLAPAGLRKEQTCVQEMLQGGQIEPSDSPWASPVVLVAKKDAFLCGLSSTECIDNEGCLSLAPDRRFVAIIRESTVVVHHGPRKWILAACHVAEAKNARLRL